MGAYVHGCWSADRPLGAGCPDGIGKDADSGDFGADSSPHMGHDLSDDDQSGFPEYQADRTQSKRTHHYLGNELADQAVHDVWNNVSVHVRDF